MNRPNTKRNTTSLKLIEWLLDQLQSEGEFDTIIRQLETLVLPQQGRSTSNLYAHISRRIFEQYLANPDEVSAKLYARLCHSLFLASIKPIHNSGGFNQTIGVHDHLFALCVRSQPLEYTVDRLETTNTGTCDRSDSIRDTGGGLQADATTTVNIEIVASLVSSLFGYGLISVAQVYQFISQLVAPAPTSPMERALPGICTLLEAHGRFLNATPWEGEMRRLLEWTKAVMLEHMVDEQARRKMREIIVALGGSWGRELLVELDREKTFLSPTSSPEEVLNENNYGRHTPVHKPIATPFPHPTETLGPTEFELIETLNKLEVITPPTANNPTMQAPVEAIQTLEKKAETVTPPVATTQATTASATASTVHAALARPPGTPPAPSKQKLPAPPKVTIPILPKRQSVVVRIETEQQKNERLAKEQEEKENEAREKAEKAEKAEKERIEEKRPKEEAERKAKEEEARDTVPASPISSPKPSNGLPPPAVPDPSPLSTSTTPGRPSPLSISTSSANDRPKRPVPGPLDLTSTQGSRSAAPPLAIASAQIIEDLNSVPYPEAINPPDPNLNVAAKPGKFVYDREFLLQFMGVCKGRPDSLPALDVIGLEPGEGGAGFPGGGRPDRRRVGSLNTSTAPPLQRQASIGLGLGGAGGLANRGGFPMGSFRSPNASGGGNIPFVGGAASRLTPVSRSASQGGVSGEGPRETKRTRSQRKQLDRKVKALLNEFTMEKFDLISDQIIELANKSELERDGSTLMQVIKLVFEKAKDDEAFSEMYARLCRKMMEQISHNIQDETIKSSGGQPIMGSMLFRKYLLNLCQEDFERGWSAKEAALAASALKSREDKAAEAAPYSEEYDAAAKAKRQGLGLVRFIGELFKLQMFTERIMHECIKVLLANVANPEEEEIESLCKLLTTVGQSLDNPKARNHMDIHFERMQDMTKSSNINPRMQLMLLDVIELRARHWQTHSASLSQFGKISKPTGIQFGPPHVFNKGGTSKRDSSISSAGNAGIFDRPPPPFAGKWA